MLSSPIFTFYERCFGEFRHCMVALLEFIAGEVVPHAKSIDHSVDLAIW